MIHNAIQKYLNYSKDSTEQQNKQQTAYIDSDIFDLFQSETDFYDENHKLRLHFTNQEQYSIKKDQSFLQQSRIKKSQSNILITFKYFRRKFNEKEIQIFQNWFLKLQQFTNPNIKQYMNEGYLIFSLQVFLDKSCQLQCLKDFIQKQKEIINNLILNFEDLVSSHLNQDLYPNMDRIVRKIKNLDLQSNVFINNNQYIQKEKIKLLQLISVLDQNEQTQTIFMQFYGENNLLEKKYKNSVKITNSQLQLINNGTLNNIEQKVNAIINSFNSKIQEIIYNLFLIHYFDSKIQRNFQFQEYQTLSEYFNGFQHQQDTFEIRIHVLIQIFCVYLIKNQFNLDQSLLQNKVILISSNKQIKLDMLEYLNRIQLKSNESNQSINEEQHSLLKCFELLIPRKEKQILIGDYNLTKDLETMKQLIAKNEIKLNYLIVKLIMIEDLIEEKLNSLFQNQ